MSEETPPVEAKRPSKILGIIVFLMSANFALGSISLLNAVQIGARQAGACSLATALVGVTASVMYLAGLKIGEKMLLAVLAVVVLLGMGAIVISGS